MISIAFSTLLLSQFGLGGGYGEGPVSQVTPSDVVKAKIVSVSMFKNGYAFVTREFPITDGKAKIVQVPQSSLGSLWFWSNGGQLDSIVSAFETSPKTFEVPAQNYDEMLSLNKGKTVRLTIRTVETKDGKPTDRDEVVEGKLVLFESDMIGVETAKGTEFVSKKEVRRMAVTDPNVVLNKKTNGFQTSEYYTVRTKGDAKSVQMMSLEYGLAWAPGYAIEIGDKDKLTFVAKSTILNDTLDFEGAKVRLITGFPNLKFQNLLDPLSSRMSVQDWVNSLSPNANRFGADSPGGFGYGGSGGGRAGELLSKSAAKPAPAFISPDSPTVDQNVVAEQLEDLLYFDLPNVSLKRGSRSYQYLYQFDAPFKRVYTWNGIEGSPITNKITFKNEAGNPISTAACSIFRKGEMVGQAMMSYTATGTEAELEISRSLDFGAEGAIELVDRQVGAYKSKGGTVVLDLVTYDVTLEVTNPKPSAVNFAIKRTVPGTVDKLDPLAKKTEVKTGVKGTNNSTLLTWDFKLESSEKKEFKFRYKTYVPTGQ